MWIPRHVRTLTICVYAVTFTFVALLYAKQGYTTPAAVLAFFIVAPAVLFLLGVTWCRFVVGGISIILILFWALMPVVQHAVDRTASFWLVWLYVALVLVSTSIASFIPTRHRSARTA